MPTRNVVLTDRQAALVERLVETGRYQNASEVLRDGLRLLEQRDAEDRARLSALRRAAHVGIEDFTQGRFRAFESHKSLSEHLAELSRLAIAERDR
jgi:antitoxin ParD1/3/4